MSTTMLVPERSLEQRRAALVKANHVRSYRKVFKADVKARKRSALDSLLCPEWEMETMKVLDLLIAIPKVGRGKAGRMLRLADTSPSKTLAGLSPRQRRSVIESLVMAGVA